MGKYFGTDGFRGEANKDLTVQHSFKVGRYLGYYYGKKNPEGKAKVVIGKDTRRSSYMFEYALVAGLTASGADVYLMHVTPTPSVSYIVRTDGFDCGIMISASHNPYYDNGIKLINGNGEKMDEGTIALVEDYLDGKLEVFGENYEEIPFAHTSKIGRTVDYVSGRNRYIGYLISLATRSYKNMRVGLDCSNGSTSSIAKSVFDALGAKTYVIGNEPNGLNINKDCGSTHIENLQKFGVPIVVTLNAFETDTEKEHEFIRQFCEERGCEFALSEVWAKGGEGGIDLAKKVLKTLEEKESNFKVLYPDNLSLKEKVETIAKEIYGADGVTYEPAAEKMLAKLTDLGFGDLPVCMAKTQYSLSDDQTKLGRPEGFDIHVRDAFVNAGAGFVVILTGAVMTMPGLPKKPAAFGIDVDDNGKITGLF